MDNDTIIDKLKGCLKLLTSNKNRMKQCHLDSHLHCMRTTHHAFLHLMPYFHIINYVSIILFHLSHYIFLLSFSLIISLENFHGTPKNHLNLTQKPKYYTNHIPSITQCSLFDAITQKI